MAGRARSRPPASCRRSRTVASGTVEVVEQVGATIDTMAERLRERILRVADLDPISQDILIGTGDQLEKHAWMLRAQLG